MSTADDSHNRLRRAFVLLLLAVVGLGFLGMIRDFLIALVLAAVFAGLLHPPYVRLCRLLRGRDVLAAVLTLVVTVLAVGVPLAGVVGLVAAEAVQVSEQVRPWVREMLASDLPLTGHIPDWVPFADTLDPYRETILGKFAEAASSAGSWLVSSASTLTQGTLGFLLGLFIMLYAMFFFLLDGAVLARSLKSLLPLSAEDRDLVMDRGLAVTRASLKGILVIGAVQGVLVALGFWVCGISGAAFWGAIVLVLSAIPGLGAPLVWIPAAGYLVVTGQPGYGIGLALWGGVVVGLVDNVLRPMLVGRDAKLPDVVILVSVLGGIATFGGMGIILGPILAAILDTVISIYRRAFAESLPS